MKAGGVDYRLVKYPGAVHSFTHKAAGTDNSKGAAYNADADRVTPDDIVRKLLALVPARAAD